MQKARSSNSGSDRAGGDPGPSDAVDVANTGRDHSTGSRHHPSGGHDHPAGNDHA
ncbi:MAG: hypothetical protein ABIQ08_04375 [Duganella sp.]